MTHVLIHTQLDLVIHLIDVSNGYPIFEKNVGLFKDNKELTAIKKNQGTFIIFNHTRENFLLRVEAFGYESVSQVINYEVLDKQMPTAYIQMFPKISLKNCSDLFEIKGNLCGIKSIDAVNTEESQLYNREFDKENLSLSLFNYKNIHISNIHYAVMNQKQSEYEVFQILSKIHENQFKIDRILKNYYEKNLMITRLIHGKINENGDYLLRFKQDKEKEKFIIRYVVNEKEKFKCLEKKEINNLTIN